MMFLLKPSLFSCMVSKLGSLVLLLVLNSSILACQCYSIPPPSESSHRSISSMSPMSPIPNELEYLVANGMLNRPHRSLYILGTVHIGSKSAQDVELLIETVKPSTVIVEVSPSRLKRIQQRAKNSSNAVHLGKRNNENVLVRTNQDNQNNQKQQMDVFSAIWTLPSMAYAGFQKGGWSGFFFSTIIVWPSLVKRSLTANEEAQVLPRKNEFETAIIAAENSAGVRKIIPADCEFDDLIHSVANSMTFFQWVNLGISIMGEFIGILPPDPIRRKKGESIIDWEDRRRDVKVSRASRVHGDRMAPQLAKVLVEQRDDKFARICLEELEKQNDEGWCHDFERTVVCLVGLVHVDGIASRIVEEG